MTDPDIKQDECKIDQLVSMDRKITSAGDPLD